MRALYLKLVELCRGKQQGDTVILELTGEDMAGLLMALEIAGEL